jgi:tetratricopeptide (TPR) repeat protein
MNELNSIKRFSQSPIWSLQRQYFEEQGILAWRNGEVPHYITNNPSLARAYAEIVFGFFRDRNRLNRASSEPIYLLELGAGSGRFAYHFLKYLNLLCDQASFVTPEFCYILSDLPQKNIDFWQEHPRLRHFAEQGMIDYARFDAEEDSELHLILSGRKLHSQSISQSLIVIANYFFDSIPQDLFFFREGEAYEVSMSLHAPEESERLSAAELLEQLLPEYHYELATSFDNVEDCFHELLENYKNQLTEAHILFPSVGLRCMERLRGLSQEGVLLLSADKGGHCLEEFEGRDVPSLVNHGSFSLTVNYHAYKSFYERQGGRTYFTAHAHRHLNVACIMLPYAESFTETGHAYQTFVERFGPDDFFSLKKHLEQHFDEMPLEHLASCFRLSGYDARLFKQCMPRLLTLVPHCTLTEKRNMLTIIHNVWGWYYPIGEYQDLAFDLGMLLYQMDYYVEAIVYFERSLIGYGDAAPVYYNMGICYYQLMNDVLALDCLEKCLQLEPNHDGARALQSDMASRIS